MTRLRLGFYIVYMLLGCIIIARLIAAGLRWESTSGLVLGGALVALGAYRVSLYVRLARGRSE